MKVTRRQQTDAEKIALAKLTGHANKQNEAITIQIVS
jgi:hypothetical protein